MKNYKLDDVTFSVSRFCPGKCLNCNIYEQDPKFDEEITLETYEQILQSQALKDTIYFSLTGGEAQLSDKYIPLIKLIAKYKKGAIVQSNISGWHTQRHVEAVKAAIEYLGKDNFNIDISVDGIQEDYEKVRLTAKGWQKVEHTTLELQKLGAKITYVMIVHKQNYTSIEAFVQLCKERGVRYYIGFFVESDNFGNRGKVEHFSPTEIEAIEKSLHAIGFMESKHRVNWEWAKAVYTNTMPFFECFMGSRAITVDSDGEVYPCGGGQEEHLKDILSMGNVKAYNYDVDALLLDTKALDVLQNIHEKACQKCTLLCAHKTIFPWGKGTGM